MEEKEIRLVDKYIIKTHNKLNTSEIDLYYHKLYALYSSGFTLDVEEEEFLLISEFQYSLFNLIDNCDEITDLTKILTLLYEYIPCIADLFIIMWCIPRPDEYLSHRLFIKKYKTKILQKFYRLLEIIDHKIIKEFCLDVISFQKNMAIQFREQKLKKFIYPHCWELCWAYLNEHFDINIHYNPLKKEFVEVEPLMDGYLVITLDTALYLSLDLGIIDYGHGKFSDIIIYSMTNTEFVQSINDLDEEEKKQYIKQKEKIIGS